MLLFSQGVPPITVTSLIIHLIGAVALLLWGTSLVRTGISRAFGTRLRRLIAAGTQNRLLAFISGVSVTALLQSSTATILILSSFVKKNFVGLTAALAVVMGADLSTTILAQILSFDLSLLSPILLTFGIFTYMTNAQKGRMRHIGRAVIGIGLMLLALSLIREMSAPLKYSQVLPLILAPMQSEPFVAILFSALLTWFMHSSLAAVLLYAALAGTGMVSANLALYLVLGANLGGGFIAFVATYKDGWSVRRLSVCNIIMKFVTATLILSVLPFFRDDLLALEPALLVVNFHTGFNIVLALLFLPLAGLLARFAVIAMPDTEGPTEEFAPLYLDERALNMPVVALAGAARETLRMAEVVERMLKKTMRILETNDERGIEKITDMDAQVDQLNQAIKLYLTRLSLESFDPKEADRYLQILTFSTNLEYCGDIIDKSLMGLAQQKIAAQENFSEKGFEEIKDFHGRVLSNLKLAQAIFLSEDPALAAQLVEQKKSVREAESVTSKAHFTRLRERQQQSVATSALHLDIVRDFRRINSYVTSLAYTILENQEKHKKKRRKPKDKSAAPVVIDKIN